MSTSPEMSYADIASMGPPQSLEEARANPVDEVIPTDQSIESLIDVDTAHVTVVSSDFKEQEVQTETQAARIAAEAAAIEAAENLAREAAAAKKADEKKAAAAKKEEKAAACKALAANPIFQANGVIVTLTAVFLGVGAYRKHQAGQFSCKVAGIWTVGVASFACADYFVSNWLWKRFPAKK